MKTLLMKEVKLAAHPTVWIFWALSAMLLIPNYPYYVVFFYTALGLFFVCLAGRENHDIEYSLSLPMRKQDVVRARIWFAVVIELVQLLLAAAFAAVRQRLAIGVNAAGMDVNLALFGLAFLMLGLFNFLFFTRYYQNPNAVGKAFVWSSVLTFGYIFAAEACTFVVPLFKERLDTPDPLFLPEKLATLAVGIAAYAFLTWCAYRQSVKRFTALDL
ncbi:MAG: ABC-2 transporter permease [Clostridia bacterium]